MLVNKAIPNLFQGVSQQPVALRLNTQAELQENALSSIVEGLKKRPPTTYVAKLGATPLASAYVHTINRDSVEKYVCVLVDDDLKVYDINGVEKTVAFPDGKGYLNHSSPVDGFSAVTVADYTLITNKSVKAAMSTATVTSNPLNTTYFFVASAPAQHTINALVDGQTGTATLGTSGGTQGGFATTLSNDLATKLGGGYTVTLPFPEVIKVVKNSGNLTTIGCSDSYGGQAIRCLTNGVRKYSELPALFESGYTIAIHGDADTNTDEYYVKWLNNTWQETVKPGEKYTIDKATMPHKLVREADGTFTFSRITWGDRLVGDNTTNQEPSFIGRAINDIFFYRNRLGLLADENVILSKAGSFFTYWVDTVTTPIDSDPIDVAVSSTKVAILRHAVPFNSSLLLFSDLTQFLLTTSANVALTQKTCTINPTTQYQFSSKAKPVGIGQDVYFTVPRGNYSGVMEYYVQPMTYTNDAAEVTAHVQKYLPSNVYKLIGSSIEESLFALSSDEPNCIYAYKFYWGDENKKVQSSWSKWKLDSGSSIIGGEIIDSRLYLVVNKADGVYLEYITLSAGTVDTGFPFLILLDHKVALTGSYNAGTGLTTWTIPYAHGSNLQGILGSMFSVKQGTQLTLSYPTSTTVTAVGDYSAGNTFFGVPYTTRYRFTEFFFKDEKNVSVTQYSLKMKNIEIAYSDSLNFKVEVTPHQRDTYTYKFTGNVLGVNSSIGAIPEAQAGTFKVPLMTGSEGLKVDIVNDSWMPSYLQSAEWNAKLSMNFKRV